MRPTDAGHRRTDAYEDADDDHDSRYDSHHDDRYNDLSEKQYDEHEDETPPMGVTAPTDQKPLVGSAPAVAPAGAPFEIRDRLIELDDLRRRGILSEEEFAAKKSELLNRI
jgi:hypothetical protein